MRKQTSVPLTGNVQSLKAKWEAKAAGSPATAHKPPAKPEQRGREVERKPDETKVLFDAEEQRIRVKAKSSRSGSRSPQKTLLKRKPTSGGLKDQVNRSASSEMQLNAKLSKAGTEALRDIANPAPGSARTSQLNLKELKSRLEQVSARQESATPTRTPPQESPKKAPIVQEDKDRSVQRSRSQSPRKPLPRPSRTVRNPVGDDLISQDSLHYPIAKLVAPVQSQATPTAPSVQTPSAEPQTPQLTPRTPQTPRSPLSAQRRPQRLPTAANRPKDSHPQTTEQNKD